MDAKLKTKFICTMKCEGGKVYDAPGNCPICNMKLVPVKDNTDKHPGQHKHHDHQKHEGHGAHDSTTKGIYYCPMHCEGEKMYTEPGDCPKCGMHLIKEVNKAPSGTVFTCSMHPEIKRDKPGNCPICGMDLIPESGDVESEEEKAYKKMAKKFRIALFLAIPVLFIAMSEYIPFINLEKLAPKKIWNWIELF